MKNKLQSLSTFLVLLLLTACSSSKQTNNTSKLTQGIDGMVVELKGNQMPAIGIKSIEPSGISATIYIYELTNINQTIPEVSAPYFKKINTKLIKTVTSNINGHFQVLLPVGVYSVFIKHDNIFYANRFDEYNNINVCSVEANKMAPLKIRISKEATF
jgi:hypothetical protein